MKVRINIKVLVYRMLGYKTIDELTTELNNGKRDSIDSKTIQNARKLSKAIMPKNLYYPAGEEVFCAVRDNEISFITHFMAPYTGGDKMILHKGEKIIICGSKEEKPLSYYCIPIDGEEIEKRVVSEEEREDPQYTGYNLLIDTQNLNKNYRKMQLKPIEYVKGDATNPIGENTKIIVHICNDIGGWGRGFVLAVSKKWKQPEMEYRNWYKQKELQQTETMKFERLERMDKYSNEKKFELGNVQFVKVSDDIWVANMIAQRDTKRDKDGNAPIRYPFVAQCLERVREFAKKENASVHMPRIGCGLAGGEWSEIEKIIKQQLIAHEIETVVYDFE